jgi:putative phosphoesterase
LSPLVAVVSDTHLPRGARRLPEACVDHLRSADLILHAGDLVSAAFLEELGSLGRPVRAVHGNMDEPGVKAVLPGVWVDEVGGARIAMLHDAGARAGREARLAARFPGCDAVVYGHTHVPQVELVGRLWVLNPGSPTERRRAPARSMLLLRVEEGRIEPALVEFP